MPIDLPKFKDLVAEKWREFGVNQEDTIKKLGLASAYGLLISASFVPLAHAYASDPTLTTLAMTNLASGVSINLLSNFIQKVFDKKLSPAELEKIAEAEPEIQQVLDALTIQANSIQSAQNALGEQWKKYSDELKTELERLRYSPASLAALTGANTNINSSQIIAPFNIFLDNGSNLIVQGNLQPQNTITPATPASHKVTKEKKISSRDLKRKKIYELRLEDIQQANKVFSEWHFVKTFPTEPFGTLGAGVLGIGQPDGSTFNRSPVAQISNCSVECDIRILNDGGHPDNWAGIRVRGFWDDIQFGYLVYLRREGTVELYRAREVLDGMNRRIIKDTINTWTNIRLDIFGDSIKVFVNGEKEPHITKKDKTFCNEGYVYLHTYGVHAEFKNFNVYRLAK